MQIKSLLLATLLPLSLTLAACNSSNTASSDAIEAREDTMKNWKDAKDSMESLLETPDAFDAEKFKSEAQFLADDASKPWQYFADENEVGGATPAVWSDTEGFQAAATHFEEATAELNSLAQNNASVDELQAAFTEVGQSCKSCHETFKAPKD